MNRSDLKRPAMVIGAVVALGIGGATIANAAGGDDDATDSPITGQALDRASQAALAQVGGGEVTATEIADEEGYYEVEVTRPSGEQVDVHLNRDFTVTGTEDEAGENENEHEDGA